MGSRAVVIVCRDEDAARRALRSRRPGHRHRLHAHRSPLLLRSDARARPCSIARADALTAAGLWDELKTDWLCLDCELMPWSAKAQELVKNQYAAVGAAAGAGLQGSRCRTHNGRGAHRGSPRPSRPLQGPRVPSRLLRRGLSPLLLAVESIWRISSSRPFTCWPPRSTSTADRDHAWHMQTLAQVCAADLGPAPGHTLPRRRRDGRCTSQDAAIAWWEELTARGGEGHGGQAPGLHRPRSTRRRPARR